MVEGKNEPGGGPYECIRSVGIKIYENCRFVRRLLIYHYIYSYPIFNIDDSFEKLLSLMVGSYYVTMHNNPSDVRKTREMILGDQYLMFE